MPSGTSQLSNLPPRRKAMNWWAHLSRTQVCPPNPECTAGNFTPPFHTKPLRRTRCSTCSPRISQFGLPWPLMTKFHLWWHAMPKRQRPLFMVLGYTLLFAGGIAVGRELFEFTH